LRSWRGGSLLGGLGGGQDVLLADPATNARSVQRAEVDAMFLASLRTSGVT
jgi:hypothetical protein